MRMRITLLAVFFCLTGCTPHEFFPLSPDDTWLVGNNDQSYLGNQPAYATRR